MDMEKRGDNKEFSGHPEEDFRTGEHRGDEDIHRRLRRL